jgi:hypothetical protein
LYAKLKRAFNWHWNLLGLGAGVVFAFLSGQPGVILPALAAAEIAYLGFLGINPRFQNILRGRELMGETDEQIAARNAATQATLQRMQKTLLTLPAEDSQRFEKLRARCIKLSQLRQQLGNPDLGDSQFRTGSLEKLLWLFLRLLNQRSTIDQYLHATDRPALTEQLEKAQSELVTARAGNRRERLQHSLEERANTIEGRMENYDSAVENRELVTAEIDKTEQKIAHICEIGMTSNSPTELGAQIDSIAESVTLSQRALADIDLGGALSEEPPDTGGAILSGAGEKVVVYE